MKYLTKLTLGLAILSVWGCSAPEKSERPRSTWVFRSVMDDRPRMLTAALHEDLWISYDVVAGNLYKAWKGGVNFDGAVYTTAHGPQPTSKGYAYLTDESTVPRWRIMQGHEELHYGIAYKGHRITNGHLELMYDLVIPDFARPISVTVSPEYVNNGNPGLERIIATRNVPEGVDMFLQQQLNSMPTATSYTTNSKFSVENSREVQIGEITLYAVDGSLQIKPNSETTLTTYFFLPSDDLTSVTADPVVLAGKDLIDQGDCKTCHNETVKTVGPSYTSISEKYGKSESIRNELAAKIISGGQGVWGEVPMTPHPDLMEEDALKMVDYILSLSEEEPTADASFLDVPSVTLDLHNDNHHESLPEVQLSGLRLQVYIINTIATQQAFEEGKEITFELIKELSGNPVLSGSSPGVHLVSRDDMGQFKDWIFHDYIGKITVEEERTYSFRLISDDGSRLLINGEVVIDNGGMHGNEAKDAEVTLRSGSNDIAVQYYQGGGGAAVSLQWANPETGEYEVVPGEVLSHDKTAYEEVVAFVHPSKLVRSIPGDQNILSGVHPAFDISQVRPDDFTPKVGGMDFMSDGSLIVSSWDSVGPVYKVENPGSANESDRKVTKIAFGLAEPLGLKVVEDTIYVLQKQELTKLIDLNNDGIIDEYRVVSNNWKVSSNFHEFAFGLAYRDGFFYGTLATAILPGGASADPQIPDRGKVLQINRFTGETDLIAHGLRTPNGIGEGVDGELFIADNQGDWLPSSKIVHVRNGAWYGSRSVDFEGTEGLKETLPVVWLPQDEIGNSPSQPLYLDKGPYAGQMMHGEVTHGGIKRVFVEKVRGSYQGAVFRFTQGLEAGVNRMIWGKDGSLYVGGIGNPGNWSTSGQLWYGLQKLTYNGNVPFEMLEVRAKSDGIELVFTEPIELGRGERAEEYQIDQWFYLPTENYGGPKMEYESLTIRSVNMNADRDRVFLELEGVKENHVVYVRLKTPFLSSSGKSLWTTEAWYTMNQIPPDRPGEKTASKPVAHNTLSEAERTAGWELLFDGKSISGWHNYNKSTVGPEWHIADESLVIGKSNSWTTDTGGDLVTEGEYEDFEFKMDWKIETGGNSGLIYNVVEDPEFGFSWITGPEFQLLDNLNHTTNRFIDTHRAGDLFGLKASDFVAVNPAKEWNTMRLVKKDNHVEHWLNGYKVLSYELQSDEWTEMLKGTKFEQMSAFGTAPRGKLALQDQGFKVWFRNIKIRNLDPVQ